MSVSLFFQKGKETTQTPPCVPSLFWYIHSKQNKNPCRMSKKIILSHMAVDIQVKPNSFARYHTHSHVAAVWTADRFMQNNINRPREGVQFLIRKGHCTDIGWGWNIQGERYAKLCLIDSCSKEREREASLLTGLSRGSQGPILKNMPYCYFHMSVFTGQNQA